MMHVPRLRLSIPAVSPSGSAFDLSTAVPAWAKRITINFLALSTTGTQPVYLRVGPSTGVVSAGYKSSCSAMSTTVASANSTVGFYLYVGNLATTRRIGRIVLEKTDGNEWVAVGSYGQDDAAATGQHSGSIALADVLTNIQLSCGTDTFDGGRVAVEVDG